MISLATGIDLVEIERFRNLDPRIKIRFCKRVFTDKELNSTGESDEKLAGRFAAKEAAAKALGCGIGPVHWHDLEVLEDPQGKPILELHGEAQNIAQKKGWSSWSVSITHTSVIAAAVVTALINDSPPPKGSG
jgi:holo-[acyl-carrier protein] synthase